MAIDLDAPLRFLRTAFRPDDWIAVLLEVARHRWDRPARWTAVADRQSEVPGVAPGGERTTLQRVRERQRHPAAAEGAHARRDRRDPARVPGRRPRRTSGAGGDRRAPRPAAAVVRRSTPHRTGCTCCGASRASRRRASRHSRSSWPKELGTDKAATSCAQVTRLPGFFNHKYRPGPMVTAEYAARRSRVRAARLPASAGDDRPRCDGASNAASRTPIGRPRTCAEVPRLDSARCCG